MHHIVATILDEICAYGRAHDAATPDRLDRLRNLDPASGAVLSQLARVAAAKHILEIGTSNGYSTLWLADAAADTSGLVLSIDIDSRRSQMAADNLARAGLGRHVELRVQDAADCLTTSADSSYDLIFLDAERSDYTSYWPDLRRTLRPNAPLIIDNVTSHPDDVAPVRALINADPDCTQALIPTGAGLLLVVARASLAH